MASTRARIGPTYPAWLERGAGWAGRLLLIALGVGLLVWLVLQVQFIATGIVLGFAIASLLWPVARWLRSRRVPAPIASILCVLLFIAFFGIIVWFVIIQVVQATPTLVASVGDSVQSLLRWVSTTPLAERSTQFQDVIQQIQSYVGTLASNLGAGLLSGLAAVGNLATVLAVAVFFALFALTGGDKLWKQTVSLMPSEDRRPADEAFRAAMRTTGNWFYASTLTGFINGVLIGAGLAILGVPLALPIGALTFLFAYIPLVGATLAGVIAVAAAFASGGLLDAVWALGIVLFVQQVEGNLLAPLLLSRAVNFPPLIVLVLTTTAAAAFGLVGLFLAVPVTGAIVASVLAWRREASPEAVPEGAPLPEDDLPLPADPTPGGTAAAQDAGPVGATEEAEREGTPVGRPR